MNETRTQRGSLSLVHARDGREGRLLAIVERKLMCRAVFDGRLSVAVHDVVVVGDGVLHPFVVQSLGKVLARVRASTLLALLGGVHGDRGLREKIAKLEGLDEIGVPDERVVARLEILEELHVLVDLFASLLQRFLGTEDRGVVLHGLLHAKTKIRGGDVPVRESNFVEIGHGLLARLGGKGLERFARFRDFGDSVRAGSSEYDDVEKRVGAETIRAVHAGARGLAGREESGNDGVRIVRRDRVA